MALLRGDRKADTLQSMRRSGALQTEALRCLFVLGTPALVGPTRGTGAVVNGLNGLGCPSMLFFLRPCLPSEPSLDPACPVSYGVHDARHLRGRLVVATWRLWRMARHVDVVICGSEIGLSTMASSLVATLARKPYVIVVHGDIDEMAARWQTWAERRWLRLAYLRLHGAILVGADLLSGLRKRSSAPAVVVPNGLDLDEVRSKATVPLDSAPAGPFALGVGRLAEEKGFDILIRAHAAALAQGAEHALVILGAGPEQEALVDLANELGVARSVFLPGADQNPYRWMTAASVVCVPSRIEAAGLVVTEAAILRRPLIVSEVCDPDWNVVRDGIGVRVPVGSVDAWADALCEHFDQPCKLELAIARRTAEDDERVSASEMARRTIEAVRLFLAM